MLAHEALRRVHLGASALTVKRELACLAALQGVALYDCLYASESSR